VAIETRQLTTDAKVDRPTAAATASPPAAPIATAEQLIPRVSVLRYQANDVHTDVSSLGREIYRLNLQERSSVKDKKGVASLLEALAKTGVGWAMLSRMLNVSLPAIRKWRQGQGASPENRKALAELAALIDMLDEQFMVEDPASWLEIPLAGTTTSLVDVYAAGRADLILDYAGRWIATAEQLMYALDPQWRVRASSKEFETYIAADGQPAIRRKTGKSVVARPTEVPE
jgi:hypothetical protein